MSAEQAGTGRVPVPPGGLTTFELLEAAAECYGDRTCVIDGDQAWSYSEFAQYCRWVAASLAELGIRSGDRVALWMVNCIEWLATDFACGLLGAVVVPLNTRLTQPEAAQILSESKPAVIVMDRVIRGRDRWSDVAEMALSPAPTVVMRANGTEPPPPGAIPYAEWLSRTRQERLERMAQGPDALAYLLYTSGTTSTPKGVMLSHANVVKIGPLAGDAVDLVPGDRVLVGLPLYSSYGCITVKLGCISHGSTMVLLSEFSARRALDTIQNERITMFHTVDTMVRDMAGMIAAGAATPPVSLERVAVIPVSQAIAATLTSSLGVRIVYSGYGLTEASAASSFYRVEEDASNANILMPLPGVRFRVHAREEDETVGELWLRSPGLMRGYYRRPDDTAAVLQPGGWLRTGDLAEVTDNGAIRFLGRIKEIIRTGGFNVAPLEVEDVLRQHPDVADAAVVGVPDERLGEIGVAFLHMRSGCRAEPDSVLAFCRDRLADFKIPKAAVIVSELPMTGSGKIRKAWLRDHYIATLGASGSTSDDAGRGDGMAGREDRND